MVLSLLHYAVGDRAVVVVSSSGHCASPPRCSVLGRVVSGHGALGSRRSVSVGVCVTAGAVVLFVVWGCRACLGLNPLVVFCWIVCTYFVDSHCRYLL